MYHTIQPAPCELLSCPVSPSSSRLQSARRKDASVCSSSFWLELFAPIPGSSLIRGIFRLSVFAFSPFLQSLGFVVISSLSFVTFGVRSQESRRSGGLSDRCDPGGRGGNAPAGPSLHHGVALGAQVGAPVSGFTWFSRTWAKAISQTTRGKVGHFAGPVAEGGAEAVGHRVAAVAADPVAQAAHELQQG